MARDEITDATADAVKTYAEWAVLEEMRGEQDESAYDRAQAAYKTFSGALADCLRFEPRAVLAAAEHHLAKGSHHEQAAAAQIVGRLGEANPGPTADSCSRLLFERLLREGSELREDLAVGLGLIWATRPDYDEVVLDLVRHRNSGARFAAAHSLALTTGEGADDAPARAALEALTNDSDAGVRGWAEFGLEHADIGS